MMNAIEFKNFDTPSLPFSSLFSFISPVAYYSDVAAVTYLDRAFPIWKPKTKNNITLKRNFWSRNKWAWS